MRKTILREQADALLHDGGWHAYEMSWEHGRLREWIDGMEIVGRLL